MAKVEIPVLLVTPPPVKAEPPAPVVILQRVKAELPAPVAQQVIFLQPGKAAAQQQVAKAYF